MITVGASTGLTVPDRVLAIGAHPDDIEFGCGATLAKWSAAGAEVHLLVLTDGSKGTWDANADTAALVSTRQLEQRAAANALGAVGVVHLGAVDGELQNDVETRRHVCGVIRTVRPDVVLGHDPWKRYRLHPDHRRAGDVTIESIVAARDPHFFPGHDDPHRPSTLVLFEAEVVDHVEDVTEHLDAKVAALLAHRSQWRSTMGIDEEADDVDERRAEFGARIRTEALAAAADAGFELGEAFKLIKPL
ncbi:MAG TPA: PIG-L deacetylase family protein [Acidimicrobiia bacterium]|nr:PIG-L deacetylase family protein [Acidimicrobiia bacterium]